MGCGSSTAQKYDTKYPPKHKFNIDCAGVLKRTFMKDLKEMTNSQVKRFGEYFKIGFVSEATVLFNPFEPADLFYILVEGQVKIQFGTKDKAKVSQEILAKKGDIFGRTALYASS